MAKSAVDEYTHDVAQARAAIMEFSGWWNLVVLLVAPVHVHVNISLVRLLLLMIVEDVLMLIQVFQTSSDMQLQKQGPHRGSSTDNAATAASTSWSR